MLITKNLKLVDCDLTEPDKTVPECRRDEPTEFGSAEPSKECTEEILENECGTAKQGRIETECGQADGGASDIIPECDITTMCQAEPTKMGKAEQGRMETECGNVDGEKSGTISKCEC